MDSHMMKSYCNAPGFKTCSKLVFLLAASVINAVQAAWAEQIALEAKLWVKDFQELEEITFDQDFLNEVEEDEPKREMTIKLGRRFAKKNELILVPPFEMFRNLGPTELEEFGCLFVFERKSPNVACIELWRSPKKGKKKWNEGTRIWVKDWSDHDARRATWVGAVHMRPNGKHLHFLRIITSSEDAFVARLVPK